MTDEPALTEHQQQMMAYIDDELDAVQRGEFERSLANDPALAAETVKFKNLIDLSRSMALSEPTDHELRRFWARFYNRTEWQLGWLLLIVGMVALIGEGLYLLLTSTQSWTLKGAVLCIAIGVLLLLWNTVRLKLRTSHFDRYRGVMR